MTVTEILKSGKTARGKDITASVSIDKYSSVKRYEITISKDGIAWYTVPCAKTTWKKKYTTEQESN